MTEPLTELVPDDSAIWQSDDAKSYQCPVCERWVKTQYEGDELLTIECRWREGHLVTWSVVAK